jgi:hypothetical protein
MISFFKDNFIFIIIVLVIAYFYFSPKQKEDFTLMTYQNPIPNAFGIQYCVPKFDETIGEYKFEKYCENPKNNPQSIPKNLDINQLSTIILKGPIDNKTGQVFNLNMIKYGALLGGNYMYGNKDSTNFGDISSNTASVKQCLTSPPQGALGFSYSDNICYFKNKFQLVPKQNINTFIFNRSVQYSISFWIKIADRTNPTAWNNILSIKNYTDTFRIPSIFIEPNTTTMQFATATTLNNIFLKPGQGIYNQESTSIDSSFLPEQIWNHVIFTIQGNQITGYVNGKNVLSATFDGYPLDPNSYDNPSNNPLQLYIGANNIYPQSGGIILQDITWYQVGLPNDYISEYLWPNITKPSDQNIATAVQFTSINNSALSISRVNVFDITGKNLSQGQMAWSSPGVQGSVPITNITLPDNVGWWTGTNNPSVSVSLGGNPYTIGRVELIVEILKSWSNDPKVYNQTAQNIINQFKNNQIRLHNSGKPGQALSGVAPASWTPWTTITQQMIQPIQDTGKSLIVKAIVDYSGGFADDANQGKSNQPTVFAVGLDYRYTKDQASNICSQYNAQVATLDQLKQAQLMGADWCATGWVSDSDSAIYPITTSTQGGCGNGQTGIMFWTPSDNKAIVNCYGIKPDQTQYPSGTIRPFSQSSWEQPQPNTVSLWGACQTSFECKDEDAYCRVGDKRCLRDSDCNYANQQDKTNRNCARMPRGSAEVTYKTYVWSQDDENYLKQNGYSDASQKARCESYGYIFTRGNNSNYPGCGGGWCCSKVN